MLLVAKRRRMALQVAVLPLVGALVLGPAAVSSLATEPSSGASVAALLAAAMLVYACATARSLRSRAHTLVVRSLFEKTTFDARAAAFGVAATYSGRAGATYTVYVTDGMKGSDIAAYRSRRALDAANQLTLAFAVANRGGSAEARGLVTREIAQWQAQEEEAMRQASSQYSRSPVWKRLSFFVGIGLALYLAVMGVVMYLGK